MDKIIATTWNIDIDKELNKLEEVVNKCDHLWLNVGHNELKISQVKI